nr:hypothetical protein [Tanacetum cinerariifolium]
MASRIRMDFLVSIVTRFFYASLFLVYVNDAHLVEDYFKSAIPLYAINQEYRVFCVVQLDTNGYVWVLLEDNRWSVVSKYSGHGQQYAGFLT